MAERDYGRGRYWWQSGSTWTLLLFVFSAYASTVSSQTPSDSLRTAVDPVASPDSLEIEQTDNQLPAHLDREHPVWRDFEPTWTDAPCPFPSSADYDPERVDCGYVLVPENRRNPDSRLIRLSISRVHSTEDSPPIGATVFLNGGPGNPIVDAAPRWSRAETPWDKAIIPLSDLILLDQRGVGHSEGFFCRGFRTNPMDASVSDPERRIAELASRFRRCLDEGARRGVDIAAYTTWDNAMDVRDIRRALSLQQWNVFGGSYGTELGQMVLRIDPGGVRAAVFDSVVSPPPMSWGGMALGMRSALTALNEACVEHGACADRYGDLAELAENAVERYRDNPLVLSDLPPEVTPSGQIVVDHRLIASGFFSALYSRQLYAAAPALIEAVAARDEVALRATATILAQPPSLKFGSGMGVVAACTGFGPVPSEQEAMIRNTEPFWFEALESGSSYNDACEPLDLLQPDPVHTFLESDTPVLLAAGAVDPITPPAYAEYVQTGLPNSFLVEVPYTGHFATSPACAAGIMADFLRSPTQSPDQSCLDDMAVIDFVTDYKATPAVYALYQEVEAGRYGGLVAPAIAILVLLAAVLAYPIAWIGRIIDGQPSEVATQRRLAWLAAVLLLGGAAALVVAVVQTFNRSVALLALGLIGPTAWVAPLIVPGVLLALLAMIQVIRKRRDVGTAAGIGLVLGAGTALSGSLLFLGLLF